MHAWLLLLVCSVSLSAASTETSNVEENCSEVTCVWETKEIRIGVPVTMSCSVSPPNVIFTFVVLENEKPLYMVDGKDSHTVKFKQTYLQEGARMYSIGITYGTRDNKKLCLRVEDITILPVDRSVTRTLLSTSHPLVFLYSVRCPIGDVFRVKFKEKDRENAHWKLYPYKNCAGDRAVSQYVFGLKASTYYLVTHQYPHNSLEPLEVLTKPLPNITWNDVGTLFIDRLRDSLPNVSHPTVELFQNSETILQESVFDWLQTHLKVLAPTLNEPDAQDVIVWYPRHYLYEQPIILFATDLYGNIIYYLDNAHKHYCMSFFSEFSGMDTFLSWSNRGRIWQINEMDVLGTFQKRTHLGLLEWQLKRRGKEVKLCYPHHEARKLPNGKYLILIAIEKVISSVDPESQELVEVDYIGDIILELDENFGITWFWDMFEHFDDETILSRKPKRNEDCKPYCDSLRMAEGREVLDWSHTNTISYDQKDGNLLLSLNNQDWVIKIHYNNGKGDGHVMWILGEGGDFEMDDDTPWFGGQHFPLIYGDELVLFDNGNNVNISALWSLNLDEQNKRIVAKHVWKPEIPGPTKYAPLMSSSQKLSNGNYFFGMGTSEDYHVASPNIPILSSSSLIEFTKEGKVEHMLVGEGIITYRTFRMYTLMNLERNFDEFATTPPQPSQDLIL